MLCKKLILLCSTVLFAWANIFCSNADDKPSYRQLAEYWAPEIDAAVNTRISEGGKGDFLTNFDYDGDFSGLNNWDNLTTYPLKAYVYYSVQETDTHYFVGYHFFHPRDDSELSVDRHENDWEGCMFLIKKDSTPFGTFQMMYTQSHGKSPMYWNDSNLTEGAGSRDGGVEFSGNRPRLYISPNGTANEAGHGVHSALNHETYPTVGNNGIQYYYGGIAEEPSRYTGTYADNRCSYDLIDMQTLWILRDGPYGDEHAFADYYSFTGDDYGTNAASAPWSWKDKNGFGFHGSFISDPAWMIDAAVDGLGDFSHHYVSNDYADYVVTIKNVTSLVDMDSGSSSTDLCVKLFREWDDQFTGVSWWVKMNVEKDIPYDVIWNGGDKQTIHLTEDVNTIYIAAPENQQWKINIYDWDEGIGSDDDMGTVYVTVPTGTMKEEVDAITDKGKAKVSYSITAFER